MEDWTSLGQHKRKTEFPVITRESRCNSRKTTWFPLHRKMKPFPTTASQEKSHVLSWNSKRYLAPLMRPQNFPDIPVSLEKNESLLLNHANTPGFLAPWGEEFNLGPEPRLDCSELLCNKVLLKYKGDWKCFWHRHQKGAERVLAC